MGLQTFYGKRPQLLLGADLSVACGKITISGIPNHQNNCVVFILYTILTNVAMGCMIKWGGLWVGDLGLTG
jgi:hypothetical protein